MHVPLLPAWRDVRAPVIGVVHLRLSVAQINRALVDSLLVSSAIMLIVIGAYVLYWAHFLGGLDQAAFWISHSFKFE